MRVYFFIQFNAIVIGFDFVSIIIFVLKKY